MKDEEIPANGPWRVHGFERALGPIAHTHGMTRAGESRHLVKDSNVNYSLCGRLLDFWYSPKPDFLRGDIRLLGFTSCMTCKASLMATLRRKR